MVYPRLLWLAFFGPLPGGMASAGSGPGVLPALSPGARPPVPEAESPSHGVSDAGCGERGTVVADCPAGCLPDRVGPGVGSSASSAVGAIPPPAAGRRREPGRDQACLARAVPCLRPAGHGANSSGVGHSCSPAPTPRKTGGAAGRDTPDAPGPAKNCPQRGFSGLPSGLPARLRYFKGAALGPAYHRVGGIFVQSPD